METFIARLSLQGVVRPRRCLVCGAVLSLLAMIFAQSGLAQLSEVPAVCRNPQEGSQATPGARATLVLDTGEKTSLSFGRDRDRKPIHLDFTVTGCEFADEDIEKPLRAQHVPLVDDKDRELTGNIVAIGEVKARDKVIVSLYIDPQQAHPGTYSGEIVIADRRANQTRVPVTATLQYDRAIFLLLPIAIIAVLIGTIIVWWKGRLAGATDKYWSWWKKIGNLFAVAVGLLAARAAWGKAYLDDPDFGAELSRDHWSEWLLTSNEWLGLTSAVVAAFVGAATAASLGGDKARGGVDAEGGAGRSA